MKDLAASGVGLEKRQSEVISLDEENSMWERGILCSSTPDKLRNTLLYIVGLNLRQGQVLNITVCVKWRIRNLKFFGRRLLEYSEDVSKCNIWGISDRKLERNQSRANEKVNNQKRCVVALFDKYTSLRYEITQYSVSNFSRMTFW